MTDLSRTIQYLQNVAEVNKRAFENEESSPTRTQPEAFDDANAIAPILSLSFKNIPFLN